MTDPTNRAPKSEPIAQALRQLEISFTSAVNKLREHTESDDALYAAASELLLAVELVRCLRRLSSGRTVREIHAAFGAPGDFGYDTPLGDALSKFYFAAASESSETSP